MDELRIVLNADEQLRVDMQDETPLTLNLQNAEIPVVTNDYEDLDNKPQINGVPLVGNKSNTDLNLVNRTGDTMTGQLTTQLPDVVIGGTTSLTNDPLKVTDKNGTRYGLIRATENTDGSTELSFIHVPTVSGTNVWHGVTLGVKADKSKYVTFSDAAAWCAGLGAVSKGGDTMTGNLVFNNGNYKGINLLGGSGAPSINFYNTGTRLTLDEYASGSTGGERYLLPIPVARSSDAWYDIFTSKDGVLAYKDYTMQINQTGSTWAEYGITQFPDITGYTKLTVTMSGGSTSDIRNRCYVMSNSISNSNRVFIYAATTVNGTLTLRCWYALSSATKDKT